MKRLFGVQVPLPEAWDGPSIPETLIWISPASAQLDVPAPSWQGKSTIYCCKNQKCCADLLPARPQQHCFTEHTSIQHVTSSLSWPYSVTAPHPWKSGIPSHQRDCGRADAFVAA